MNSVLLSNRPKDIDEAKFKAMWENSSYLLEALYKTLLSYMPEEKVKAVDFDTPNHYPKLMYQAGQRDSIHKIIELLPKSLTNQ